jgi:very-short-patch-repair endonuclease
MRKAERNKVVMKARELRRTPTLPEGLFRQQLRQRPHGLKFRGQHPLGPFVVNLCCPAVRLVVEMDGDSHDLGECPDQDARRDRFLREEQGLRVVRFNAGEVMRDVGCAVTAILVAARG